MTTYTGTVRDGAVVLDPVPPASALPEGARVTISVTAPVPPRAEALPEGPPWPFPSPPAPMSPEDAAKLDEFVAETYRLRHSPRDTETYGF